MISMERGVAQPLVYTCRLVRGSPHHGLSVSKLAAVAPLLGRDFGVGLADIGILIGLSFTLGVALALPGGAIGQRFGDKRTVLGALLLMLIGGLAMAWSNSWTAQIAGRLVAGAGGVICTW